MDDALTIHHVTLLLGNNLGNRLHVLARAEEGITADIGKIIRSSGVYETGAWGNEALEPYLNKVVEVETKFSPQEVMQKILQIEALLGRKRTDKWESRIIDIDILFFENEVIDVPGLVIPHPFLHKRRFTLVPLVEIAASKVHPVLKRTCRQLLDELVDPLPVAAYKPPPAKKDVHL